MRNHRGLARLAGRPVSEPGVGEPADASVDGSVDASVETGRQIDAEPDLALASTGVGSMPGSRADESARISAGECPDLPFVVELPDRGPGAEMVGRALGWVQSVAGEFSAELSPQGWRLAAVSSSPAGRVQRRAVTWLRADLDDTLDQLAGFGGTVKIGIAGPLTLAAAVETSRGHRAISDAGLCRDLAAALAASLPPLIAECRSRLATARWILQLDEPALPGVLRGELPRTSGWGHWPPVPAHQAEAWLRASVEAVREAGASAAVHCCGRDDLDTWSVCLGAGVQIMSTPVPVDPDEEHPLGGWLDSGRGWIAGVDVDADPEVSWHRTEQALDRIGIASGGLPQAMSRQLAISPPCGLASAGQPQAIAALRAAADVASAARRTWQ